MKSFESMSGGLIRDRFNSGFSAASGYRATVPPLAFAHSIARFQRYVDPSLESPNPPNCLASSSAHCLVLVR